MNSYKGDNCQGTMLVFVPILSISARAKILMLFNSDQTKCPGRPDETKCCMPNAGSKGEKDGDNALEQANADNVYDVAYDSSSGPDGYLAGNSDNQEIQGSVGDQEAIVSEVDNGDSVWGEDYARQYE